MTTITTKSTEGGLVITSNDGHLDSASAVLEVRATNPDYNQPVLRIKQAGLRGGTASLRIDDPEVGGNIGIGFKEAKDFKEFGGGKGVIVIASAAGAPTESVPGAGILYVEDGALKYRGSNGTVTIIAPA